MYRSFFSKNLGFKVLGLSTGLFLTGDALYNHNKRVKTCGIVGYLGNNQKGSDFVVQGLQMLQSKGYDSAGMASVTNDRQFIVTKYANDAMKKIDSLQMLVETGPTKHKETRCAIGHTRWATIGAKTDENAHPHTDQKDRIALVHNGSIDDVEVLRAELLEKGVTIKSQTDSELIAQFIGLALDDGMSLTEAVQYTLEKKIRGTWGLVVIAKDQPDKMIVCRNGSPLFVGWDGDDVFVASDQVAFERFTSSFIRVSDGEMIQLDVKNKGEMYKNYQVRLQKNKGVGSPNPKSGYDYFLIQEIMEQSESLLKCMNHGARLAGEKGCTKLGGLEKFEKEIVNIQHMIIVACGSSNYAGMLAAKYYRKLGCFHTVTIVEATELTEFDFPPSNGGCIFISQSGETQDVYKPLKLAKKKGLFTLGVVNVVGSLIAKEVDCGVFLNCGTEVAVPATKSFTGQFVCLLMIGIWIAHHKDKDRNKLMRIELIDALHQLPSFVGRTLTEIKSRIPVIVDLVKEDNDIYVLGKGPCAAVAREAALKMKEVTYIHTEGFSAGEFRHGPAAMINPPGSSIRTKIFFLVLDDEYLEDLINVMKPSKTQGAVNIVITDCKDKIPADLVDEFIPISSFGPLTPLLFILPFHLLSYELAKVLKRDPDRPRNLTKTVMPVKQI